MADAPSNTETHLLIALRRGPSYGYALLRELQQASDGAVSLDLGSLYRTLARLVDRGWVTEVAAPADAETTAPGRPRRYYGLTSAGEGVLEEELSRMEGMIRLARGVADPRIADA